MTRSQVVSFIVSFVVCLVLVLAGWDPVINALRELGSPWMVDTVTSLSLMTHFENFQKGVLDSRDVIFFLSIMVFSLFSTSVVLRVASGGLRKEFHAEKNRWKQFSIRPPESR